MSQLTILNQHHFPLLILLWFSQWINIYWGCLYSFARAAVIKYHKLSGKKTEFYSLTLLEARSLRSRCWQVWLLWGLWGRICSLPLSPISAGLLEILDIPWLVEVSPWPLPSSSLGVLPECTSVSRPFFYKDTHHIGLGPILMTSFNLITSAKTISPNWVISWVTRSQNSNISFWGHNSACNIS